MQRSRDPNLMVGFDKRDDAAVYRLSSEVALISTVDFITPPVDDPHWFGQISAANSLSDVYAMGGRPLTALNLVMFPSKRLDIGFLKEILRGGAEKVAEAGAALAGGHTVDDNEPKYGLAVTGIVHPDRVWTNSGAKAGDVLILTKPLGTGVLFNAGRSKKLRWPELEAILPRVAALNDKAMEIALQGEVDACTDITGFGILGHVLEMAQASGVQIELHYEALPFYPHALDMYRRGETTGSNAANRQMVEAFLEIERRLSPPEEGLLVEPQTSGGLLLAVPRSRAESLVQELRAAGLDAGAPVGEVRANPGPPMVRVT